MGRFELIVGEARDGSPVYKQAHSGMLGKKKDTLLYRFVVGGSKHSASQILHHQVWG